MRISKLLPRILTNVVPVVAADFIEDPQLTPTVYNQIAKDAANALITSFNEEWMAENPNDKEPPINITL